MAEQRHGKDAPKDKPDESAELSKRTNELVLLTTKRNGLITFGFRHATGVLRRKDPLEQLAKVSKN